jgi:hypothetical protein
MVFVMVQQWKIVPVYAVEVRFRIVPVPVMELQL